ncbi:hypothetical protein QFC22_000509 [Naganishia vaughanmartiniae]|uniref:Uncharacterized protein n=1 Tax=Naganishia vaughanmartiniae TaxID=1424756 RepID=A0ACC2XQK2_9TREE|nr:hypothetical protein QFC22_000509 [Naganishia vaughanmartiniae]
MMLRQAAKRTITSARSHSTTLSVSNVATLSTASRYTSHLSPKPPCTLSSRHAFNQKRGYANGGGMPPGGGGGFGGMRFPGGGMNMGGGQKEKGETLKQYSIDLTEMARENKLDPIIGRDDEIRRTIQILSRKTKSNPVLLGHPGVGKTAILEGLAQRIVNKEVPESLQNKRLLTIDLASLIAGSGIRGQFEEKFKNLLEDIQEEQASTHGGVICFIDELHTLLNLGKAEGSLDAGNMIKPALARGLKLVGATTLDEYRKYIEKDQALARRFQPIIVEAPSVPSTITILRGLRSRYETHFGVQIADSALVTAAMYADRYIPDRFLPDKAIDLVDEAASALKLSQESKPDALEALDREMTELHIERESLKNESDTFSVERLQKVDDMLHTKRNERDRLLAIWETERKRVKEIKEIKVELDHAQTQLEIAQREGNFELASRLRYSTIPGLKKKLPSDGAREDGQRSDMMIRDRLTSEDIARVVAKSTGIPVENLREGETERLLHIEHALKSTVVGQDKVIDTVANAIRLSRAGLQSPDRPLASFLFLGPSGVGKSSLTKAIARFLFADERRGLIQINMSEMSEKHNLSRLTGATPGYVGYEEGGDLCNAVRRKPYSVVVFDEIEKAHPDVANILLQILEEGVLTDGQGNKVNFKNTLIILTSNLGSGEFAKPGATNADGSVTEATRGAVLSHVRSWFRPELIGRLDEMLIFNSLPRSAINDIVRLRLAEIQERISDKHIVLDVTEKAIEHIAFEGYSEQYGAREVARVIRDNIVTKLASRLLEGTIRNGDTVRIDFVDGKMIVPELHPKDEKQGENILEIVEEAEEEDEPRPL